MEKLFEQVNRDRIKKKITNSVVNPLQKYAEQQSRDLSEGEQPL